MVQQLRNNVANSSAKPTGTAIAKWLVSRSHLTRYQATILASGSSGPFHFGPFQVYGCRRGDAIVAVNFGRLTRRPSTPSCWTFCRMTSSPRRFSGGGWTPYYVIMRLSIPISPTVICWCSCPSTNSRFSRPRQPASLLTYLTEQGPPDRQLALKWLMQLLQGLVILHDFQLVHGRIRPENIVIDGGSARLVRYPARQLSTAGPNGSGPEP